MGRVRKFEDLESWQEARKLTGRVYRISRKGPFSRDFGLKDQMQRSAISVMANISEGFGRKTDKDFAHFLYHAKASAMEVISHLYVAIDQNYLPPQDFKALYAGYNTIISMLTNLIKYLESNNRKNRF